jgi:hypothetical protein
VSVDVRAALVDRYERMAAQALGREAWLDRADALRAGEISVEPGWMLVPILGESIEPFALYRVYPDGRVERDRMIERAELRRFREAGHDPGDPDDDPTDLRGG